jgi:hypothetical protein
MGAVIGDIIGGIVGLIIASIKETICTGGGLLGVEVVGDVITGFASGGIVSWLVVFIEIVGDVITGFASGGIGVLIQNVISAIATGIEGAFGIIGNILG